MKEISANGVKGYILKENEKYVFRTYNKDGTFSDYDLNCEELQVTIEADNCSLYESNSNNFLDFSSEFLGIKLPK